MSARVVLLAVIAVASMGGCRRKAPGPDECRKLALAATGVQRREDVRSGALLERVDLLTRECLVTPYDRTFVRCMEEVGHYGACRRDFVRRHPELAAR